MLRFGVVFLLCVLLVLIGVGLLSDLHGRAAVSAPVVLSSSVLGRPALSASFVNRVLTAYHSLWVQGRHSMISVDAMALPMSTR